MKMRWMAAAWAAIAAACLGCSAYPGVREVMHERQDPVTGARLQLYVAKQSYIDDRPIDRKTLKVLTPDGVRVIFVETRDRGNPAGKLTVNRDGRQWDASANDWAVYRSYMRHFEEEELQEGPAQTRRGRER